ncbi:hypothetical protein KC349_g235 [Hortaea werneckii]|nr:hypothetical protein KC349_g235 [Hortaea werneckii]
MNLASSFGVLIRGYLTSFALMKPQSCSRSSSFGLRLAGGGRREAWRSGVSTTIDLNSRSMRQVQNRLSSLDHSFYLQTASGNGHGLQRMRVPLGSNNIALQRIKL